MFFLNADWAHFASFSKIFLHIKIEEEVFRNSSSSCSHQFKEGIFNQAIMSNTEMMSFRKTIEAWLRIKQGAFVPSLLHHFGTGFQTTEDLSPAYRRVQLRVSSNIQFRHRADILHFLQNCSSEASAVVPNIVSGLPLIILKCDDWVYSFRMNCQSTFQFT